MDKNNNANKIEKIRRKMEASEFAEAMELADQVDSTRIKSAADLSVLAEAYYKNNDYQRALLYFEQIYQKTRTRRILIHLINLCLKLSMADMAEAYLKDFIEMAPKDFYRHIFRYRIDKLRGEALDVLVFDLELLREDNYMEDWAYELAKLYHKSGQTEKCISECDDIILWFGSGTYVERAKGLRAIHLASLQSGELPGQDAELAQEVRRLVSAGRSSEEVENFIEESTTPEGRDTHFSEEEYRSERFGEPVYEEDGMELIWNTREFGPITDEITEQQNTMDALRGMQIAEQIKLKLRQDSEIYVEGAEEQNLLAAEEQTDHEEEQDSFATASREEQDAERINQKQEDSDPDKTIGEEEAAVQTVIRPARKSMWEKRREEKARKRQAAEDKKKMTETEAAAEEAARRERETEERLYRLLQEEEQEAELSEAIRNLSGQEAEQRSTSAEFHTKTFILPKNGLESVLRNRERAEEQEKAGAETRNQPEKAGIKPEAEAGQEAGVKAEQGADDGEIERMEKKSEKAAEQSNLIEKEMKNNPTEVVQEQADAELAKPSREIYLYPEELMLAAEPEPGSEMAALLNREDKKLSDFFADFLPFDDVRKQLLRTMEQLAGRRPRGAALIISGEEKSGKTTLAKAIAKAMQVLGLLASSRVALIRGEKLNHIPLGERREQLRDAVLVIERASELTPEKAAELAELMPEFAGSTVVILEDKRSSINQFLRDNKELNSIFSNRIHLPEWSDENYFLLSLTLLAEREYQLMEDAAECYLNEVGMLLQSCHEEGLAAVYKCAEAVMSRAEQRMTAQLKQLAFEGRYQEANLQLIILEDVVGVAAELEAAEK